MARLHQFLCSGFQPIPVIPAPHVADKGGVHISVAHMTEGGNDDIVLLGNGLGPANRLRDLGRRHPEVLGNGDQTIPRLDSRQGGNQAAPGPHHLFSAGRVVGPLIFQDPVLLADLADPVHVADHHFLDPVRLHDQEGLDLAHILAQGLFHDLDAELVHDLAAGELDARGGHLRDRIAGGIDITENGQGQGSVFRLRFQLADDFRDDAERSFCRAEKTGEIVAEGGLGRDGPGLNNGSIDQDHLEPFDVVLGGSVFDGPVTARIGGDHTADGRDDLAAGVGREHEAFFAQDGVELHADDARLHTGIEVLLVDLQNLVHVVEIQQETAPDGQNSPGGAGAASARHHRNFVPVGQLHDGRHLFRRSGEDDRIGNPLVDRHDPGNSRGARHSP